MIRIDYGDKIKQINEVYWKWFSKYHLASFKGIIESDDILKAYFNQVIPVSDDNLNLTFNEKIKRFLTALPQEQEDIKSFFDGKDINEISKQYFLDRYENYRKSQAPKILDILDVKICPYCNRNYIDIYYDKNNKAVRYNSDLDHFYPKTVYPYLAINPYNLIPCCKVCNHEKGNNTEKIFNPFINDHIDLYKFKTNFSGAISLEYLFGESSEFDISINYTDISSEENRKIVESTKKILKLEDKYEKHKDYVKELIQRVHIYNEMFLDEIEKEMFMINLDDNIKLFEKSEVKKVVFQNDFDQNRHGERSLSKLTYDILNEFGIY